MKTIKNKHTHKKTKKYKRRKNQQGGFEPITMLGYIGISMLISLLMNLMIGWLNVHWAYMYPNHLIEDNNKIIMGNYILLDYLNIRGILTILVIYVG